MDILDTEHDKLLNIFLITFQNCIPNLQSFKKLLVSFITCLKVFIKKTSFELTGQLKNIIQYIRIFL